MKREMIYRVIGVLIFLSLFYISLLQAILLNITIAAIRRNMYPTQVDIPILLTLDKKIGRTLRELLLLSTTATVAAVLWYVVNRLFY